MAANSTAAARTPGRSSSAEAMLAPLEKPTAYQEPRRPVLRACGGHELREIIGARRRSSSSNTPSLSRRKNRGMPFSNTVPRGDSTAAPGTSARRNGSRSCSSPPVPCSSSSGGPAADRSAASTCGRSRRPHAGAPVTSTSTRVSARPLDLLAVGLQPGRQLEVAAELEQGLVDGEPGLVGRDLEQHAAGFTEVDRCEVLPVEDLGHRDPRDMSSCRHRSWVGRSGARKAMWWTVPPACRPRSPSAGGDVDQGTGVPAGHREPGPIAASAR